jgi:hypothetical protein
MFYGQYSLLVIALLLALIFIPLIWGATRWGPPKRTYLSRSRRGADRDTLSAEEGWRWMLALTFFVGLLLIVWLIGFALR